MSTQEHLYLHSQRSPSDLAGELARAAGMTVVHGERGATYLTRPLRDSAGDFGGELRPSDLADPESFVGAFPLVLDVGVTVGDRDRQLAEARRLLTDLSERLRITAALTRGHDFLVGFTSPSSGLVWFPEGVTPYAEDRRLWLPLITHRDRI